MTCFRQKHAYCRRQPRKTAQLAPDSTLLENLGCSLGGDCRLELVTLRGARTHGRAHPHGELLRAAEEVRVLVVPRVRARDHLLVAGGRVEEEDMRDVARAGDPLP